MPLPRHRHRTPAALPLREVERAQVLLVDGTLVQSMVWVGWNEMQQQERTPR
jgi:hypothetical protein